MPESNWSAEDKRFMERALRLAAKGRGRTNPNPMVGAVIVEHNRVVGEGYHKQAGGPHAEIVALEQAALHKKGQPLTNATLYVNLEPCCHVNKKTPPCLDRVLAAGFKRIVIAMPDPNPQVNGRSIERLRKSGIQVDVGLMQSEARFLNEVYLKYIITGQPFVTLKIALSMDGKIATKTGDSKWISGEEARQYVHKLRNEVDATCVGIGTIMRDNSRLTTRLKRGKGRDPVRVVIDSLLKVPLRANIFTEKSEAATIIVTTQKAFFSRKKADVEKIGSKVLTVRHRSQNKVDLTHMIEELGKMGIAHLMIEGGAEIAASSIQEGIVDKIIFFISPKIIGGKNAPGPVGGEGIARMEDAIHLQHLTSKRFGEDIMIEGYIEKAPSCVYSPLGC